MTGNLIKLYRVPWALDSQYQPYFMSDTARDSYFNGLTSLDVTPQNGNVNIHLGYNYELELIIPIDVTLAEEYNFVKVIYNSQEFYANILDYRQVSVGYTELQLKRHALSEKTNYLSHFKNFNIKRATNSSQQRWNGYLMDSIWHKPTFRYKKRVYNPAIKFRYLSNVVDIETHNVEYTDLDCTFENCLILYLGAAIHTEEIENAKPRNIFGTPVQYEIYIIPLRQLIENVAIRNTVCQGDMEGTPITSGNGTYNKVSLDDFVEVLNKYSPQILGYKHIYLPCGIDGNFVRLPWYTYPTKIYSDDAKSKFLQAFVITNTSYFLNDVNDCSVWYNYLCESEWGNIEIRAYSKDTSIILDKSELTGSTVTGTQCNLKVEHYYFLDMNDDEIVTYISSDNVGSVIQAKTKIVSDTTDLGDSISYVLDAEANFEAQNRYYDAMTRSVRNHKQDLGYIEAGENFMLAASQFGFAHNMGGAGADANNAMGVGNVIRGIGNLAEVQANTFYYLQQREIYAANEKAKPDQGRGAGNGNSRYFEAVFNPRIIEDIPFNEDLNVWMQNTKLYGIELTYFQEDFSTTLWNIDGNFFFQADAVLNDNVFTTQQYAELYKLMTNGCRYFIVEEQESNKLDGGE